MTAKKDISKKKEAVKQSKKATPTPKNPPQRRRSPEEIASNSSEILDSSTKRDIAGICYIVLGIVLMIFVCMPQEGAFFSAAASAGLHLTLGVGCYILPILLVIFGVAYIFKTTLGHSTIRLAIGLALIYVALLGFFALFAPIERLGQEDLSALFSSDILANYGGYIGSAITWAGIFSVGRIVTGILLAAIAVIGLVIIGFSISRKIEEAKVRKQASEPLSPNRQRQQTSGFARVRMAGNSEVDVNNIYEQMKGVDTSHNFDPNQTMVFGAGGVDKDAKYNNDYPELAQPDYLDGSYSQFEGEGSSSKRLNADEVYENSTRRLIPIQHADSFFQDDAYAEVEFDSSITQCLNDVNSNSLDPNEFFDTDKTADINDLHLSEIAQDEEDSSRGRGKNSETKNRTNCDVKHKSSKPHFKLPSMSLLQKAPRSRKRSYTELSNVAATLQQTLADFGVMVEVVDWIVGPTVTLFEVNLPPGVRVSRVTALNDDIALALASPGIRIFAPVPGTNYVGIEVPNVKRETVYLSDVLKTAGDGPLKISIGKDVEGHSIVLDLAKMPHLLIGGSTGSGKSVAINAMIMSILMRATPDEVRFILIDPKRVEFTPYNGIPHLFVPVVTEPKEAASALAWGVAEMERRLKIFSNAGARNITQYNDKARKFNASLDTDASTNPADVSSETEMEVIPYIVIVIDELADLMMNVGKDVEISISRIAQLARAAGIHLIVATQRPSTNVVTGLIKANITNRIAFNVASSIDSRVILDTTGAENLIGLGDLLLSRPELAKPQRIQACYVSESEITSVVDFIKAQASPEYHTEILKTNTYSIGDTDPQGGVSSNLDPLIWDASEIIVSSGIGSTSSLQRKLKVGYARAGRIMDQLEELGIVGPSNGSKSREVLVDESELELIKSLDETES